VSVPILVTELILRRSILKVEFFTPTDGQTEHCVPAEVLPAPRHGVTMGGSTLSFSGIRIRSRWWRVTMASAHPRI